MANSQNTEKPAAVTQAKRDSYLRYVQIHIELLQDSFAGHDFGCGVGQEDRAEIDRHLVEIWGIACDAKLVVVDPRPAPSGDDSAAARKNQSGKVIPFRPRLVG
jgi:hypothetical protein